MLLALSCREAPPPPDPVASARAEAERIVEAARREVSGETLSAPVPDNPLYVPERIVAGGYPLLIFLHGLGGSGVELASGLELRQAAEAWGFAFLAPEGHTDFANRQFWNADPSCCNFDQLDVDHVALLRDWIVSATAALRVDASRVYLVGFSNGGFMAHRAACEMAPLLRGIFSIAGAGPSQGRGCKPSARLSVVEIHGDRDAIVAFKGGYLFADRRRPAHPSAEAGLLPWVEQNGCTGALVTARALDLDPRLPGGETEVFAYGGCGTNPVELWRIRGGDHVSGLSHDGLRAIWQFIASNPAPRG